MTTTSRSEWKCERCGQKVQAVYLGDDKAHSCVKCLTVGEYNGGRGLLSRLVMKGTK